MCSVSKLATNATLVRPMTSHLPNSFVHCIFAVHLFSSLFFSGWDFLKIFYFQVVWIKEECHFTCWSFPNNGVNPWQGRSSSILSPPCLQCFCFICPVQCWALLSRIPVSRCLCTAPSNNGILSHSCAPYLTLSPRQAGRRAGMCVFFFFFLHNDDTMRPLSYAFIHCSTWKIMSSDTHQIQSHCRILIKKILLM